ncbi:MAG: cobalt ECF transporter T component CbiQ [Nitrospirota bacterium]|nr:cobalt ECF transporter T component CbiQ [Nitrospirota bacterium]
MIPDWLAEPRERPAPPPVNTGRVGMRQRKYLDRTLQGIARLGREAAFLPATGSSGLFQAVDPRVRILSILLLIVAASFARTPLSLVILCLMGAILAAFSRISLGGYLARVWLVVPLFTAAIALPAMLNVITPGTALVTLFSFSGPITFGPVHLPEAITVTREGLIVALMLVLRAGASLSMVMLVMGTTPWHDLLRALRALKIPSPFLMILSMAYRYLFVLVVAVEEMCLARKSRGIDEASLASSSGSGDSGRGWVASRMGALYRKSRVLGEEVGHAMISRGFRGEVRSLPVYRFSGADLVWSACSLIIAVAVARDLVSLP